MSRNQNCINFFGPPLIPGDPLAKQIGMVDKINTLCKVLERLDGLNGITVSRTGTQWEIIFNPGTVEYGSEGESVRDFLLGLAMDMVYPEYVLGRKTEVIGGKSVQVFGWVETTMHEDQHPEVE